MESTVINGGETAIFFPGALSFNSVNSEAGAQVENISRSMVRSSSSNSVCRAFAFGKFAELTCTLQVVPIVAPSAV